MIDYHFSLPSCCYFHLVFSFKKHSFYTLNSQKYIHNSTYTKPTFEDKVGPAVFCAKHLFSQLKQPRKKKFPAKILAG